MDHIVPLLVTLLRYFQIPHFQRHHSSEGLALLVQEGPQLLIRGVEVQLPLLRLLQPALKDGITPEH